MVVASLVLLTCLLKHTWTDPQQGRPSTKTDELVVARPTICNLIGHDLCSNGTKRVKQVTRPPGSPSLSTVYSNIATTHELTLSQSIINEMHECSIEMGVSINSLVKNQPQMEAIANKAANFLSALWEVIPHPNQYLSHTKSPCWHSNITADKGTAQFIIKNLAEHGIYSHKFPKLEANNIIATDNLSKNIQCFEFKKSFGTFLSALLFYSRFS